MKKTGLLLLIVLMVSLTGCTEKNKGIEPATVPVEETKEDTLKITVMVNETLLTRENGQDAFIARLEEMTGCEIEIIQPDHTAYYDEVGQAFSSNRWPDVVLLGSTYYAGYASEKILWDMTEIYEQSKLKERIENQNLIDALRINGLLYGIPSTRGNGCVTYVKKAWLDRVGMDTPTNFEEYMEMCRAFTVGDPDGNGVDGDTYALSAPGLMGSEAPYTNYLPEFYQDANPSFYRDDDGVWHDGFAEQPMRDALQRLQDAYTEGLLDKETLTNSTSDCRNKFFEDRFGVFTYWAGSWENTIRESLIANGLDGELVVLPPLWEDGFYVERMTPCWCITEACENPEAVFHQFIEPMLDGGDVEFLWTYGVEGVHWSVDAEEISGRTYQSGEFHMRESMETEGVPYTKVYIDPGLALVPLTDSTIPDPTKIILGEDAKESLDMFFQNCRMADLLISTEEMIQYNRNLLKLKNEIIAKVVMGSMSVEEGMEKFEKDRGMEWSRLIVDSLNR